MHLSGRFTDLDEFAEATQSWGLNFQQLERGQLNSRLEVVSALPTSIMRFHFNRRLFQRGQTPEGFRTFGIPGKEMQGLKMYGRDIVQDAVVGFHPNGAFEGVSQSGFSGYTISISENLLMQLANSLGFEQIDNTLANREHILKGCQAIDRVRSRTRHLLNAVAIQPALLKSAWIKQELDYGIPAQLLMAYELSNEHVRRPTTRLRDLAVGKAIEYIEENASDAPTIADICRFAQVSWRTLDYAFRERFGMSPKRFLMAVRLSHVQRELLHASSSETTICGVASRWGFWHMGQFSRDYRQFTGEKPSDTLNYYAGARKSGE